MPRSDTKRYCQGRPGAARAGDTGIPGTRRKNDCKSLWKEPRRLQAKDRPEDTHGRVMSGLWVPTRKGYVGTVGSYTEEDKFVRL